MQENVRNDLKYRLVELWQRKHSGCPSLLLKGAAIYGGARASTSGAGGAPALLLLEHQTRVELPTALHCWVGCTAPREPKGYQRAVPMQGCSSLFDPWLYHCSSSGGRLRSRASCRSTLGPLLCRGSTAAKFRLAGKEDSLFPAAAPAASTSVRLGGFSSLVSLELRTGGGLRLVGSRIGASAPRLLSDATGLIWRVSGEIPRQVSP